MDGCRLTVARSDYLSLCDQVKLMSETDILASPHGAQLMNMFLMERDSGVMEFYPRGWLELTGVGQDVYKWEASRSRMRHQGSQDQEASSMELGHHYVKPSKCPCS
ncbi:hypothetical protein AAC387_Pa05g3133 [Persea americana]